MNIPNVYERPDYHKLLIIPLALMFLSLFFIPMIPQGIDLKGGALFTVYTGEGDLNAKVTELEERLSPLSPEISVRVFENPSGRGLEIEMQSNPNLDEVEEQLASLKRLDEDYSAEQLRLDALIDQGEENEIREQRAKAQASEQALLSEANYLMEKLGTGTRATNGMDAFAAVDAELQEQKSSFREDVLSEIEAVVPVDSYTSKEIGASLSKFFFSQVTQILLFAFVASGIVIVLVFRSFLPSLAVIFGAFADLIITLGLMGLFQIPLTLATVAALLMLVGFSLDTDMLLTIRVLKRSEGNARQRIFDTMKTAFLMNATTVAAFAVLLGVASILQIQTYSQIGAVAVIGGIVDFIATWTGNAALVLWHADNRGIK
ncbi:hypothetical protein KJ765_05305 [Candidatus Micrarchaeota archaeon]|nr:hypothetical protein [Candidatus Micrarchaeota archaeon]